MYNVYCGQITTQCCDNNKQCSPMKLCEKCEYRKKLLDYKKKITQKPYTLLICMRYKFPNLSNKILVKIVNNYAIDLEIDMRSYYIALYGTSLQDVYTIEKLKKRKAHVLQDDYALRGNSYWSKILYISIVQFHHNNNIEHLNVEGVKKIKKYIRKTSLNTL